MWLITLELRLITLQVGQTRRRSPAPWNYLVWNKTAVLIVVFAILELALLRISLSPVDQQASQKYGVKHHEHTVIQRVRQEAPRVGCSQLKEVLKVTRHAPKA